MPRNLKLHNVKDFTGGLNLRRDPTQLDANESPDLLNVDVDPRGGFSQRKGVAALAGPLTGDGNIKALFPFHNVTGVSQVIAQTSNHVWYSSGGEFTNFASRSGLVHGATFKGNLYMVDGTQSSCVRWNGTVVSTLGQAWNNNLESPTNPPTNGNVPYASLIATHMSYLWVASTIEDGVAYPNRIRWSHPNFPEDWRQEDYIDIDVGVDGDRITALVPFGDTLLIFKHRGLYALQGYDTGSFRVRPITTELGTPFQGAVVSSDIGVYFWSWPDGLYLLDGDSPKWQFERLAPAVEEGVISNEPTSKVMLGWGNRRLWLSVVYDDSSARNRTFVLDPTLGKAGSWVAYDLGLGPFCEFQPAGDQGLLLAAKVTHRTVVKLDQLASFDRFTPGVDSPIDAYYTTKFFDLDAPAVPKRWRRPEVVMQAGAYAPIHVTVYRDYDYTRERRQFEINARDPFTPPDPQSNLWGSAAWDNFLWGGPGTTTAGNPTTSDRNELHRGSPLGNARSVALTFRGPPDSLEPWGVTNLVLKYIPRRPRP